MNVTLRISINYIRAYKKKISIVLLSVFVVNLLLSIILGISNGIGKYVSDRYSILGDSYILIDTTQYSKEVFENIENLGNIDVDVFVSSIYDTKDYCYRIVSTTNANISILNNTCEKNEIDLGRFFNDYEKHNKDNKVVITQSSAINLSKNGNVIGKRLPVKNDYYEVVGVLRENENDMYIESDDEISTISMYMPLSYKAYEFSNVDSCIYYVTGLDNSCKDYVSKIEKIMNNANLEMSIITSDDVDIQRRTLENKIKLIFGAMTIFSMFAVIMILIGNINSIILDMTKIFTFYKVMGIGNEKMQRIVLTIESLVIALGFLFAEITEWIISIVVYAITGFNMMNNIFDIAIVFVISVVIISVSYIMNRWHIKKIRVMKFFRN